MKITLESTTRLITVDGVPARIWEGRTEAGVPVIACITRVAAPRDADHSEFERDLEEHKPPSSEAVAVFPLRLVL